jgi:hypothetical protein
MPQNARSVLFGILLLLASPASAGEPWDKKPEQWSLAEVSRILTDSPWSPAKAHIDANLQRIYRHTDPLTRRPSEPPSDPLDTGWSGRAEVGRGAPLAEVSVLWWSAKTPRLAQERFRQLKNRALNAPLTVEDFGSFVIAVEGTEPMHILRDAVENLRETVFLELPSGMALEVTEVRFIEGQFAGEDFVAFYFPREVSGRATIPPETERVVFHLKATAKAARPGQPNSLAIRAVFSPRKMRVAGHPDF